MKIIMTPLGRIHLLLIFLGLSSCSTNISNMKIVARDRSFSQIQRQINEASFGCQIKGKVSWQNQLDHTGGYGYLYWEKHSHVSRITLYSPFNVQNLTIEMNHNNQINSVTKNGKPYNLIKGNELLYIELLLPKMDNLIYWLFGVPNPRKIHHLITQGFQQDGWIIDCFNYKPNKNILTEEEILLPTKISLTKTRPPLGENTLIKIIINELNVNY